MSNEEAQTNAAGGQSVLTDGLGGANHKEAYELACMKREESNLARAYMELAAITTSCRSSVKFDLLHYEKMALAYGNIGREGEQTAVTAEAEAQRLHALLEKIDALALTTPNASLTGGRHFGRPG